MHGYTLILTLTGGLGAALILGYFTQRLGLSPIVGYLLAGMLVGPHSPGFVADAALAEQLAEIGVILLMFGVGLQFHIEELLAVRRVARPRSDFAECGRDDSRCGARARLWMELVRGADLRDGAVCRQHGRSGARPVRQQRTAHPGGSHRGGLAGCRRPVHRHRTGDAPGAFRYDGDPDARCGWRLDSPSSRSLRLSRLPPSSVHE